MIRVLVMANESLLADTIVSILSQQADMEVFRRSRDEQGLPKDYSVVVVVDEGVPDSSSIKLTEIIRESKTLLLVRVSLESRNIRVEETYEIMNPGLGQVVNLVRDFNRRNRTTTAQHDSDQQKKMNWAGDVHADKHDRQNTCSPMEDVPIYEQAISPEGQTPIRVNRRPLLLEAWNTFTYLSLYQVRRTNLRSVTLPNRDRFLTGSNKV